MTFGLEEFIDLDVYNFKGEIKFIIIILLPFHKLRTYRIFYEFIIRHSIR